MKKEYLFSSMKAQSTHSRESVNLSNLDYIYILKLNEQDFRNFILGVGYSVPFSSYARFFKLCMFAVALEVFSQLILWKFCLQEKVCMSEKGSWKVRQICKHNQTLLGYLFFRISLAKKFRDSLTLLKACYIIYYEKLSSANGCSLPD